MSDRAVMSLRTFREKGNNMTIRVKRGEVSDFGTGKWQLFRKKPIVISAFKTTEQVEIETLEGFMTAEVGDWIIRGVQGEIYPCKDLIFKETYQKEISSLYFDFPARAQAAIVAAENEGDYRNARGVSPVPPDAESPEVRIRRGRGG